MRRGPPSSGVHRARTFALFVLPGGRPRRFTLELDHVAEEEAEGSMGLGSIEEEVALEEEGEVPEVSRRLYLRGAAGVDASSLGAGIKALAQRSAAKRRTIMMVRRLGDSSVAHHFVSPAAVVPRIRGLCIFTWSSDRALTRAIGGPISFWGPPALRSLKRVRLRAGLPGATVGVLDTEVSRSTCFWASSTAQLRPRGETTTEAIGEDPHEEAPHEENGDQNC
jgi:hypothetical protein